MIKRYNAEKQLAKLMKPNIIGDLEDVIIFQNTDGSYELFNMYHITKNENNEYIVTMHTTFTIHNFNTLKHAVAWCTFDKRNMFYQDTDNRLIVLSKLSEDKLKKRRYTDELYTYINDSKKWQTKRFDTKP